MLHWLQVDSDEDGQYTFYLDKAGGAAQLLLDGRVIIDTDDRSSE